MAQSSLLIESSDASRRALALVGIGLAAILLFYMLNGGSYMPALAIAGLVAAYAVYKAAALTRIDRQWLIVPLVMLAIFIKSYFLQGAPRAVIHYGLTLLFCAPCIPIVWRAGIFRRGGFELYSIYFVWALATVTYSLAPHYSIARLSDATLVFCAISTLAFEIKEPTDVTRVIERYLLGCGAFVIIMAAAAVLLPRSITWDVSDLAANDNVLRFRGLLNNPNEVGVLMLATVGPTLAFWSRFERRWKKWFALFAVLAIGECGLADSRTPFVALGVGCALYLIWLYRLRGILLMAVAATLAVAALPLFGHSLGEYTGRGDVTTLTGRTEMWAYVVDEIKRRPIIGYGYECAGAIFQNKYFPIWYGPWDEGAQSSLHDGYFDHAIGVGVPATLFWLFLVLRPWWSALRRREDPWNLKPLALLVVIPCLLHNISEASVGDFTGLIGLLFGLVWAVGERYRMLAMEQAEEQRQRVLDQMPPAVALFHSMKA
jgi:O-antigen ligase